MLEVVNMHHVTKGEDEVVARRSLYSSAGQVLTKPACICQSSSKVFLECAECGNQVQEEPN